MFNKNDTVESITKAMNKMVGDLKKLAERREQLSAEAVIRAEAAKAQAEAHLSESIKARQVADKIAELVA